MEQNFLLNYLSDKVNDFKASRDIYAYKVAMNVCYQGKKDKVFHENSANFKAMNFSIKVLEDLHHQIKSGDFAQEKN